MHVYILLYNARTENEGIHTIRKGDQDTILMFKYEDDAIRYALMLEAQDFPVPTVEGIDSEEIADFCESAGYGCQLIDEDQLELPPETNVPNTDWQEGGLIENLPKNPPQQQKDSTMDEEELARIRRQLEGLL
jgi:hypothetical protein